MSPSNIPLAFLEDMSIQLEFSAVSWGWSYAILLGFLLFQRQYKAVAAGASIIVVLAVLAGAAQ